MAYIQERKGKNGQTKYRVQVRVKGYPIQTATFDRKTDAKKWANSIESAIDENRFKNVSQAKKHTAGELIDLYISDYLPHKPKSESVQRQQLEWWKDQFGNLTLAELTTDVLVKHRNKLAKRPKPRGGIISPSTVNRYLAALSHVLTIAVKELKWLPDTPMQDVSKLKEPKGRVRYLSDDERTHLLEACEASDNPYLLTIVILAISTGMRKNEILSLTEDAIDLERQMIFLEDTKNGERRSIPLVGKAYTLIERMMSQSEVGVGYLFPGGNPSKPIDIKKAWYTALRRAGIDDFRFHDLRHTAASYLVMNGASDPEIAEILGHKNYQMVKRYAHLSDKHVSSVVKSMNAKVFGDETPELEE